MDFEREKERLRQRIVDVLTAQGYIVDDKHLILPQRDKQTFKKIQHPAVERNMRVLRSALSQHEPRLVNYIANGTEVDPQKIKPYLVVCNTAESRRIFDYLTTWWSAPIGGHLVSALGMRQGFLVFDAQNDKVIGCFMYATLGRFMVFFDRDLGIIDLPLDQRVKRRVVLGRNVVNVNVCGAVPPYSFLLGGKLIAMLAASDAPRRFWMDTRGYDVVLQFTTSAHGKSSIYNRIKYNNIKLYESIGYTQGTGDIHFMYDGLYDEMFKFWRQHCSHKIRAEMYSKMDVIRTTLTELQLPCDWVKHHIPREIFKINICSEEERQKWLEDQSHTITYYDLNFDEIAKFWKKRWCLPRSERPQGREWLSWRRTQFLRFGTTRQLELKFNEERR